jgi:hypothetical protein
MMAYNLAQWLGTGTGSMTLSALSGVPTFITITDGLTLRVLITDLLGNSEESIGVWALGSVTLTRDRVLRSSNGNALVNFPAGTKTVLLLDVGPLSGYSGTITTAKLTGGGSNGSMTFTNGVLTSQTAAT